MGNSEGCTGGRGGLLIRIVGEESRNTSAGCTRLQCVFVQGLRVQDLVLRSLGCPAVEGLEFRPASLEGVGLRSSS